MLEIVEILRPAEQGRNKAVICRGEDDQLYFVKGKNAGRRRQCCEWMVGNLAKEFGIPVPAFHLVNIPENLIAEVKSGFQGLGAGVAFASEAQSHAQWFEPSFVNEVPDNLRLDVLVFDWWVQNDDRLQDNPNLLWDAQSHGLHVIDHDSAFSPDFFPTVFRNYHIFQRDLDRVFSDIACQAEYSSRMSATLSIWDDACHNAPPDWIDHLGTSDDLFSPSAALKVLERCLTTEIWRME
ncbi:MAG: HipA family kinase [Pseudomonadota bacterium]